MFAATRWRLACTALLFTLSGGFAEAAELQFLGVTVNASRDETVHPVLMENDRPFLSAEALGELRITLPDPDLAFEYEGTRYYPADGHQGSEVEFNESDQTLLIYVPTEFLEVTALAGATRFYYEPTSSDFGGFLNYDLLAEYQTATRADSYGGVFELGVFADELVGTTTHVINYRDDEWSNIRLDSTVTLDQPADRRSWRFGDSISRGGAWGRPVRFGGIQFGTNFGTQPNFIGFPTISLSSDAALPSTVDVLVNDSRRFSGDVPSGPFTIDDIPAISGAGEVTAVVTDVLGRQTIISQPYYVSPDLLKEGLHDFSYEAGALRKNFGVASFDYDTPFVSGTHRYGFSDSFTGEAHGEFDRKRQAFGLGFAAPIDVFGVLNGAVAVSHRDAEIGGLAQLGFERSSRDWTFSISGRLTTDSYRDFGVESTLTSPTEELLVRFGLPLGDLGSFSAGYSFRGFRQRDREHVLSGGYSVNIADLAYLNLSALATFGATRNTTVALSVTVPLGERASASGSVQASRGGEYLKTASVRLNKPPEGGFGAAASVSDDDDFTRARGEVSYRSAYGDLSASASHFDGDTGVRLNAIGGLATAGGDLFMSRRIDQSFAVVTVAEQPDVRVYSENRLIGTTNGNGNILIPNLRAYEANRIGIDLEDLPLDAQLDKSKDIVAPRFRSGIIVDFPVDTSRSVLLSIYNSDGEVIPSGATVKVGERVDSYPVGLDGEVFLHGAETGTQILVRYRGGACQFVLDREIPEEPIPDLGPFTCHEVTG